MVALVPLKLHGEPMTVPVPLLDTVTCPSGGMNPPTSVSVTDTVQIVGEPVFTGDGTHVMLVVVERAVTVRLKVLLVLPEWDESPA